MGIVDPGTIELRTAYEDPQIQVHALLGAEPPKVVEGYGGWQVTPRPRRMGLTEWQGSVPLLVEIPILFENFLGGLSLEQEIEKMERLAGWAGDDDADEPPILRWDANAPHDFHDDPDLLWVVEDLQWGDSVRNDSTNRIRQFATIRLRQWVGDEFLSTGAAKAKKKKKSTKKKRKKSTYTVKKGVPENLRTVAAKVYGDANLWHRIGDAQKPRLRDGTKPLKPGTVLRIPEL